VLIVGNIGGARIANNCSGDIYTRDRELLEQAHMHTQVILIINEEVA
jgi:hypothetical protein